jgi:hypothetical protein
MLNHAEDLVNTLPACPRRDSPAFLALSRENGRGPDAFDAMC